MKPLQYWFLCYNVTYSYQIWSIINTLKYSDDADNITRCALIRFPSEEHNVTSWRTPSVKNDAKFWTSSDEWCSHSTCIFVSFWITFHFSDIRFIALFIYNLMNVHRLNSVRQLCLFCIIYLRKHAVFYTDWTINQQF